MTASGDFSIGGEVWPGVSKVLEEMGELGQVLGKLIGSHGEINHFDGSDLSERLIEELGDLLGAVLFFVKVNDLPLQKILLRKSTKYNLFWEWHGTRDLLALAREAAVQSHPDSADDIRAGKCDSWVAVRSALRALQGTPE